MKTYKNFKRLSSGHYLALYISHIVLKSAALYIVAICIFRTKRECNYWFRHQDQILPKSVNFWGMEGILKAVQLLKELQKNIRSVNL